MEIQANLLKPLISKHQPSKTNSTTVCVNTEDLSVWAFVGRIWAFMGRMQAFVGRILGGFRALVDSGFRADSSFRGEGLRGEDLGFRGEGFPAFAGRDSGFRGFRGCEDRVLWRKGFGALRGGDLGFGGSGEGLRFSRQGYWLAGEDFKLSGYRCRDSGLSRTSGFRAQVVSWGWCCRAGAGAGAGAGWAGLGWAGLLA